MVSAGHSVASVRTLALAAVALAAPTVQPPVYLAANSGAWHGVMSTSGVRVKVPGDRFSPIAFAPDRAEFLAATGPRSLLVKRIGARVRRTLTVPLITAQPVFGYRGRIVYGSGQTIRVVDGPTIRPTLLRGSRIVQVSVSRDGAKYLITVESGDGRQGTLASALYVIGGGKTRVLVGGFDAYSERPDATFSPDASRVAFVKGGDVWVMPTAGGKLTQITHTGAAESGVQWSPDGTRLAYTTARHGVNEVYVATLTGRERRLTHTKPHPGGVPQRGTLMGAWSPNGRSIAVITYNTVGVVPATGGPERVVARVTPEASASLGPVGWPPSS